jgi:hypothetical protein
LAKWPPIDAALHDEARIVGIERQRTIEMKLTLGEMPLHQRKAAHDAMALRIVLVETGGGFDQLIDLPVEFGRARPKLGGPRLTQRAGFPRPGRSETRIELAQFSGPVSFVHAPCLADSITTTPEFRFSVHTRPPLGRGRWRHRGRRRNPTAASIVKPRRKPSGRALFFWNDAYWPLTRSLNTGGKDGDVNWFTRDT